MTCLKVVAAVVMASKFSKHSTREYETLCGFNPSTLNLIVGCTNAFRMKTLCNSVVNACKIFCLPFKVNVILM